MHGDSRGCGHLEHPGLSVSPQIVLEEVEKTNNPEGTGYTMLLKARGSYIQP